MNLYQCVKLFVSYVNNEALNISPYKLLIPSRDIKVSLFFLIKKRLNERTKKAMFTFWENSIESKERNN